MGYVFGAIVLVVLAYFWWRWTSVARGAKQRDERILKSLEPIGARLDTGDDVTQDEIREIAQRPETRFILFNILREIGRPELIPDDFSSAQSQAESALAYWCMHPNELQDAPERIQKVQDVTRPFGKVDATFHVFRYKMPSGHWAAEDGWLLGLAGPIDEASEPYSLMPQAFSRCDVVGGDTDAQGLVEWWVGMLAKKGKID